MTAHTLLNLDPRDAEPPPSIIQPTVTQSFLETAGKSLTLYMIGSSRLHRKMSETSRVEMDELPASIPWIVFDKARTVVKLFHTRSVASQFQGGKALNSLGWLSCCFTYTSLHTDVHANCLKPSWIWFAKPSLGVLTFFLCFGMRASGNMNE